MKRTGITLLLIVLALPIVTAATEPQEEPRAQPSLDPGGETSSGSKSSNESELGPFKPIRHWVELFVGISFGRDSNVRLREDGSSSPGQKRDNHGLGYGGVDYRLTTFDDKRKVWELGLNGQTTRVHQFELHDDSSFDWNLGGYVDREVHLRAGLDNHATPIYRLGLQARRAEFRLDDGAVAEINQAMLGGSIALRQRGECELSRWFAFVAFDEVDDRKPETDPALNQDGDVVSTGVRRTIAQKNSQLPPQSVCQGGGTFRKLFLTNYWVMHGEYVHRWVHTDGTDFRRNEDIVRLESQWPLSRAKLILDVDLSYTRSDFSRNYGITGPRRRDDTAVVDVSVIRPLIARSTVGEWVPRRYHDLSLRLGGRYIDNQSNIGQFAYDRAVFGVDLHYVWGRQSDEHTISGAMDPDNPGAKPGDDIGTVPKRPKPDGR